MSTFLGKGTYGKVTKINGTAVKDFQKLSHIIQEHIALKYLDDCNYIIKGLGVNYKKKELSMVLCDMSLRKWLNQKNNCKCLDCIHKIIHDILCGLVELQDRNLSHSDIKPGNILIQKHPLKAVLGDCGFVSLAKYSKQDRTAPAYRDIVIVADDKHDIYSFGICFLELLYKVKRRLYENYNDIKDTINNDVHNSDHRKLLFKMLHPNRNMRPSARELLQLLYKETPDKFIIQPADINEEILLKNLKKKYYHLDIP